MAATFARFLEQQHAAHGTDQALIDTVAAVVGACGAIQAKVRLGALAGVLGEAGSGNVQGEAQKKLDVIANDILVAALKAEPAVAGLASEE